MILITKIHARGTTIHHAELKGAGQLSQEISFFGVGEGDSGSDFFFVLTSPRQNFLIS